jgi:D-psicose/D-tagatose/L-ribulose 3-epimerase
VDEKARGIRLGIHRREDLAPWREFLTTLQEDSVRRSLVIESFDPSFEELNRLCAIWRRFAKSRETLAVEGLGNLRRIAAEVESAAGQG